MVLTFSAILLGLVAIIRPLQRNPFYILNAALVIGIAQILETYYFRTTPFSHKTIMFFFVIQFITINFTTFLAYFVDKRAAIKGAYRIPESNLHTLEFLGGTLGALLGQKILHHKNRKKSFRLTFLIIVILQISLIIFILKYLHLI